MTTPIRIINTFDGQTVTDVTTVSPFHNVTISDPNDGQTETLTIAVTDTAGATASDSKTTITTTETASPLPIGPFRGIDYNPSPANGASIVSPAQIDADMAIVAKIGNAVRLYTVSNGMAYAVTSAIAHGLQVIPSAYLVDPTAPGGAAANDAEIRNLIDVLNNADLSKIPFVDVGSDFLTNNPGQIAYLTAKIQLVQNALLHNVLVTASESADTYLTTNLGSQVDLIFPTISPFAQGGVVTVGNANAVALLKYWQLIGSFPNKNIVLSGIGWPSSGNNGSAVGSVANEEIFWIQFIQTANQNKINYFGFEAFDSPTNVNPGFSGPNWGLYTASGTPKGVVTSFSPPPQIVGAVAGQQTTDLVALSPFSGLTVTDSNPGQTETVTITLSAAANGTLGHLGGGSYNATTGVYVVTGSPAAVTAAVDGLTFTPTQHLVAFGQTFTTTFAVAVSDTAGATAIDSTTTVTTTEVIVEANGVTSLWLVGTAYVLASAGGTGPTLKYLNNAVTVGQFGAFAPIGAEQTATGYEIAWKLPGADAYVIWNTGPDGNYTGTVAGPVSGSNPVLEALEPSFQQDLNNDGTIGVPPVVATGGSVITSFVFNVFNVEPSRRILPSSNTAFARDGLSAPSLSFIGTPDAVTIGSTPATVIYNLEPSGGIGTVANFVLGIDELDIDLMGAAIGTLRAFDTLVDGHPAIALASNSDLSHGIVLLGMPTTQTAADLLANHMSFNGRIAIIS